MNEERTGKCLRQVNICMIICDRYSIMVNQVKLSKSDDFNLTNRNSWMCGILSISEMLTHLYIFILGELKDPSKAIPKGTLSAICFTFVTYFILMILVGFSCNR